jgi:hypothetical protein
MEWGEEGLKQDAAFFEGKDPVLIYIGKKLNDSLRLEKILTAAAIDYGVEADEYRGGVLFRSARVGAFFYVLKEGEEAARHAMEQNGFVPLDEEKEATGGPDSRR